MSTATHTQFSLAGRLYGLAVQATATFEGATGDDLTVRRRMSRQAEVELSTYNLTPEDVMPEAKALEVAIARKPYTPHGSIEEKAPSAIRYARKHGYTDPE